MAAAEVFDNFLTHEQCRITISNFEEYIKTASSVLVSYPYYKKVLEFALSKKPEWETLDKIIASKLTPYIKKYYDNICPSYGATTAPTKFVDTGYNIQLIHKNKGYIDLHDYSLNYTKKDEIKHQYHIGFIIFLNFISDGGEICFHQKSFNTKEGSILFFPTDWTHSMKITTPKDNMYSIIGFIQNQ